MIKKRIKKFVSAMFLLVFMISTLSVNGYADPYNGSWAFKNCTSLTTIGLPADVSIYKKAFSGCYNLSTVRYYGKHDPFDVSKKAFKHCPNLKKVQVPVNYKGHRFGGMKVEKVLKAV